MKLIATKKSVQIFFIISSLLTIVAAFNYKVVVNHSESLPINGVVIELGKIPSVRDQIFVFRLRKNQFYQNKEVNFIKKVGGLPGDNVVVKDREILVDDKVIGTAQLITKGLSNKFDGKKYELHPLEAGKIPPHKFFAYTPHLDSFDSRYQEIGLIDEKDIIGTALFAF